MRERDRAVVRGASLKRAIHAARAQKDIKSDEKLAEMAGVSPNTLGNWLSGRTAPELGGLANVADVLEVRVSYLLDEWQGVASPEPAAPDALYESMERLTAVIHPLVQQAVAGQEARLRALEAAVALQAQQGAAERPRQRPRRRTTE